MNMIAIQILSQTRGSVYLCMDGIHRVVAKLNHKFIQTSGSAVMFWVLTQQCSLVLWSVCTLLLKTLIKSAV